MCAVITPEEEKQILKEYQSGRRRTEIIRKYKLKESQFIDIVVTAFNKEHAHLKPLC